MSPTEKDRKFRSIPGITFPAPAVAEAIAKALHREFDDSPSAVKIVVSLTGANPRAVKNWFDARNAPSGEFLIALCRHSNEVLRTFLVLAGRNEQIAAARVIEAREQLRRILTFLDSLDS
jgi:hypothetical protein